MGFIQGVVDGAGGSERGQERKTEFVEACNFMGIKPKNSS